MMIKWNSLFILAGFLLLLSCVNENEYDLFHRDPIPDSSYNGFLAFYCFDGDLTDSLDLQNDFEWQGSPEYTWGVAGDSAGAIFLDGMEDHLRNFLEAGDSLAFCFWLMPYPNWNKVILFDYGAEQLEVGFDAVSGATMPSFQLYLKSGEHKQVFERVIDCFYWHHFFIEAGSSDRAPRVYIDGWQVWDTIQPFTFKPLVPVLYLGSGSNADTTENKLFRGYFDNLRIYNDYLTDEQIENLYWEDFDINRTRALK